MVAREQDERAALGAQDELLDLGAAGFPEGAGVGRGVGQVAEKVQLGLAAIVEGAAELERGVLRWETVSLLEEVEAVRASD